MNAKGNGIGVLNRTEQLALSKQVTQPDQTPGQS
jgi:hypothetical protein